jgi:hypothetical protein
LAARRGELVDDSKALLRESGPVIVSIGPVPGGCTAGCAPRSVPGGVLQPLYGL